MAEFKVERWMPDGNLTGFPRRDRQGGEYSVYIPDRLVRRPFMLRGQEAADLGEAERDVERFDLQATVLANTEALPRILLRAESVGSSKIEGLEVGAQRLLRAEASEQLGHPSTDVTANDVVANIRAMEHALAMCDNGQPITPELLLEVHERLLRSAEHLNEFAGRFREVQNWIGESSFNPCSADFVPPPWELVPALLDDLCQFCNDDSLPVLAQAAIAHAAFETIHPFVNGNGRVGRALIHMILRRRRLTTVVTPPISLVLATFSRDYVRGLTATRYTGSRDADSSRDGINLWLGIFAAACRRAVSDALAFEEQIAQFNNGGESVLLLCVPARPPTCSSNSFPVRPLSPCPAQQS
ncbi:MAG: Fic family protein [Vulcanimicrobiaceae bacterium]